jgi:hypothetical protein
MTMQCLRGHEWEATETVVRATRLTPEERTIPASAENCPACKLHGFGPGEDPDYEEYERDLRYCETCCYLWDVLTGQRADIDLNGDPETCPECRAAQSGRAA